MNTRTKGTRKELECLKAFRAWMQTAHPDHKEIGVWRSIANKFNNTDLYSDFDLALAYHFKSIVIEYRIQVKSKYEKAYYESLREKWKDSMEHNYLAVYQKKEPAYPKGIDPFGLIRKIGDFWFVKIS